jgi:hypothetical protein
MDPLHFFFKSEIAWKNTTFLVGTIHACIFATMMTTMMPVIMMMDNVVNDSHLSIYSMIR